MKRDYTYITTIQKAIDQIETTNLENIAELVFFLDFCLQEQELNQEAKQVLGKAEHALYVLTDLSEVCRSMSGEVSPATFQQDGSLIEFQQNLVGEFYNAFIDSDMGKYELRKIKQSLEDYGEFEVEDAIYRVKPVIYETLYPERFSQLWNQYTSQGQSSFMAWTAAYITLQDEVEGRESRTVIHDAAMEYIKQLGADKLGIEAQFMRFGIGKNIAVQLTFGALWHEDEAINDGLEQVPAHLKANVLGTVQRLADSTSALFNRIQAEIDPSSMLAAAQLINGIRGLEQLEQSDGRNQALATAYYDLAVMTGCIGEDTPDDPFQLTDVHYATLKHFIRVFCETERGEAAFKELEYQDKNPTQVSENLLNPLTEPEIHNLIPDTSTSQALEAEALGVQEVLQASETKIHYIAKLLAKTDTVFLPSDRGTDDCQWRIGSSLNIINETQTPSPKDLTTEQYALITKVSDFFYEKHKTLITKYAESYRQSNVMDIDGEVIDEIIALFTDSYLDEEEEVTQDPPIQHFRLPNSQVVWMYETAPGHYSMSLDNPEHTPINQYISAGWEPIDDPGYVGMPPVAN